MIQLKKQTMPKSEQSVKAIKKNDVRFPKYSRDVTVITSLSQN